MLNSVRIIANKVLSIHSRGGEAATNAQESMEQQAEVVPARSATMKQVWRPKQVISSSA